MARRRVKVFFDGGSRPNPGHMEAAVVIRGVEYLFEDLGIGTNTDAEWLALLDAQRTLAQSDADYAQATRDVAFAQVDLFRALGGTWQDRPMVPSPAGEQL